MSNAYQNHLRQLQNELEDIGQFVFNSPTGHGQYTTPVNAIFNRQTTDIRSVSVNYNPLAHQMKKELRALISRHNNEIFGFLGEPSRSDPSFAETIFRRFGLDATPINRQYTAGSISREFNLDSSLNVIINDLNEQYSAIFTDASASATTLQGFMHGMKWVLEEYKKAGYAVFEAENTINQQLGILDNVFKKVNVLHQLPDNDTLPEVYEVMKKYTDTAFKASKIEEKYNELIAAYKKWNLLRELISVQQMFPEKPEEPICAICVSDSISHTISPCGHTFCSGCIKKMNTSCYICRGTIRDRVRLYFN